MPGLAKDLAGVGIPVEQAQRLGTDVEASVTTAGTTQGTATAITSRVSKLVTASSQTGAILPATAELMQPYYGYNSTATTGVLYPPSSGTINGGTANAGVNVAQGKSFIAQRSSSTNWIVTVA